jgi:putative NIF3 family GTP cyclohydrolase 1 type 2
MVGVRGESDVPTAVLLERAKAFSRTHGGDAIASAFDPGRHTRHWAICTGGGASAETLQEAVDLGVDTLIVGEGPHWTAVDAPERGLVIVYAGHYATETLGVIALAEHVAQRFDIPWTFITTPTGL